MRQNKHKLVLEWWHNYRSSGVVQDNACTGNAPLMQSSSGVLRMPAGTWPSVYRLGETQ